jgi:hypothetical protein
MPFPASAALPPALKRGCFRGAGLPLNGYTGRMNWPTFITSLITAVIVAVLAAFLTPRFQHLFWKRQKFREQRVSIAERFAALHGKFTLGPVEGKFEWSRVFEEDALLIVIQVLFEREDVLISASRLRAWLNTHPLNLSENLPIGDLMELWALRVDLLSRLFAEAFEISENRIRSKTKAAFS